MNGKRTYSSVVLSFWCIPVTNNRTINDYMFYSVCCAPTGFLHSCFLHIKTSKMVVVTFSISKVPRKIPLDIAASAVVFGLYTFYQIKKIVLLDQSPWQLLRLISINPPSQSVTFPLIFDTEGWTVEELDKEKHGRETPPLMIKFQVSEK